MAAIVSALFEGALDARRFYHRLRDELGVPDDAITIAGLPDERETDPAAEEGGETERYAAGVGGGAAAGVLLGVAASLIPGLVPLAVVGGAIAAAAAAGAVAGGLATYLAGWGVPHEEAAHYARRVEEGAVYIGIDLRRAPLAQGQVLEEIERFHGVFAGREAGDPLAVTAAEALPDTVEPQFRRVPQPVTTESTAGYVAEGGYAPVAEGERQHREEAAAPPAAETIPVEEDETDEGPVAVHHAG